MKKRVVKQASAKTRVMEHELEAARKFIQSDPIGKRFQAAEHILTLLIKEELPRLKRFIFNASFDLREIIQPERFEKAINTNPRLMELARASRTGGYVRIKFEKDFIQFVLFYDSNLNPNEAALFSDAFGKIVASTYSSLGIDMSGSQTNFELSELKSMIQRE